MWMILSEAYSSEDDSQEASSDDSSTEKASSDDNHTVKCINPIKIYICKSQNCGR